MLYVTTRNNRDVFTAYRAMQENRCSEGGQFLPFRHPSFTEEELETLLQKPYGQCIADILNLLFGTKLTGWDVDLCIGRSSIRVEPLQHKILLAECWHTPGYRFNQVIACLASRVAGGEKPFSGWVEIGIRTAVLFGIFADLRRIGIVQADFACLSGDFCMPISAWYAKRWGLPVGKIICCCNENNSIWDLLCHGQLRTDTVCVPTILPAADITVPDHLERLIYEYGGIPETQLYLEACRKGRSYCPSDLMLSKLRKDLYVSVVSTNRITALIPSVYKSHGKLLSRATALSYGGLLDYRAKTGSTGSAILWSEEGPVSERTQIAEILGIPEDTLDELL